MLKDEELLPLLRGTQEERNKAIHQIYHDFDLRRMAFSQAHSLTEEGKEELWQDAMTGVCEAFFFNRFKGDSKLSTYIVSIVRNKWLAMLNNKQRQTKTELTDRLPETGEEMPELSLTDTDQDFTQALESLLSQMGQRCREMLMDWAMDVSPRELAEKYKFSSYEMAKKESHNCRKRFKKLAHSNPNLLEKLKEWLFKN